MDIFQSYCRTCMTETSGSMFNIFTTCFNSSNAADFISCTANIQPIHPLDDLPKQICDCCYKKLLEFHEYRKQIEVVDRKLREIFEYNRINFEAKDGTAICFKTEQDDFDDVDDFEDITLDHNVEENIIIKEEPCIDTYTSNENFNNIPSNQSEIKSEKSVTELQKRPAVRKKRRHFKCVKCSQVFSKHGILKEHYITDHEGYKYFKPKRVFACEVCKKEFNKRYRIVRHMAVHAEKPTPFACSLCTERFHRKYQLNNHIIDQHGSKNNIKTEVETEPNVGNDLVCDQCLSIYDTQQALAAHKRTHIKPNRILACSICAKVFKKLSHVKRHELSHAENRPYKCNECPKTFLIEEALQDHLSKHKGKLVLKQICPICSKEFANRATLSGHIKLHTGLKKDYLCPTCGKNFDSSNNLKQHMRRHLGEKPFNCDMCPKKFVSKGELESHYITHTGEKKWSCDQCGALFTKSTTLTKHKLIHLGIKPHGCDICPMKFLTKDHLRRHYRIHTGEKPYKCDICERCFTQSTDLVKHKRSHLGANVYKCDKCPESFRLKSELTQHLSKHYVESKKKDETKTELVESNSQSDE